MPDATTQGQPIPDPAASFWIETYRGAVPPWQCDMTEHFTIAYYFDRLEESQASLAEYLGLTRPPDMHRQINARFARELRAGASFHVETAPLGVENGLRIGHRFVDSTSNDVVTWFDEHWDIALSADQRSAIAPCCATWNGPQSEHRDGPAPDAHFRPTAAGRVKPADLDAAGQFALGAIVHRFSNASNQFAAAIGMDAAYLHSQRRGFSTFELILTLSGALPLDAPYQVATTTAHFGSSSLRMIHRMTSQRTGAEIARLSQFGVNLDLDARRPARWPDDIRLRATAR